MTTAVYDALAALKARVLLLNPTPQTSLGARVWIYPQQFASISLATLPVAIVSKVVGTVNPWGMKDAGRAKHDWRAEVLIPLAEGPLAYPNAASAAAEATQEEYLKAMADVLFGQMKLGGTVDMIGRQSGNETHLFEYMTDHMQWFHNGQHRVYWGHRFVIPIRQTYPQTMTG